MRNFRAARDGTSTGNSRSPRFAVLRSCFDFRTNVETTRGCNIGKRKGERQLDNFWVIRSEIKSGMSEVSRIFNYKTRSLSFILKDIRAQRAHCPRINQRQTER